nr:hypothetical protein [Saprospiraceae bacterium]
MKTFFYLLCSLLILSSCAPKLSVYTKDLHNSLNLSQEDTRKIQFYLNRDLVLERANDLEEAHIKDGKITLSTQRDMERVVIPAKTRGVALFSPDGKKLAVSFDPGSDEKFLIFGPNPKMDNRYMLYASEWQRNFGIVTYGGGKYRTLPGAERTTLMVVLNSLNRQKVQSRTERGRRP